MAASVSKAMQAAYQILSVRSRSEEELKEKLRKKGVKESFIEQVVSSLRKKGYLNDVEFSLNFAQYLLNTRHYGLIRIGRELRKRRIPEEIVQDTIHSLKAEIDEEAMVVKALEMRLKASDYQKIDEKSKRRIIQFLCRKGFHLDTIYEVLKSRRWKIFEEERE
jgi:regulatory protein